MSKRFAPILILAVLFVGNALALDGVFDRSAEVAKYMELATQGTRGALLPATKDIYVSGLSDRQLADVLLERILRDIKGIKQNNTADVQYARWLIQAVGSFGVEEHIEPLSKIKKSTKTFSIQKECDDAIEQLAWHRRKNEIMASRANYNEGDNPRVAMLMNLIKSDDFSYKNMAADRISWEKLLDPKLLDEISAQLLRYMNEPEDSRAQGKALGLYVKILGYSGEAKYRDTLQQVAHSNASMLLKRRAKEASTKLE